MTRKHPDIPIHRKHELLPTIVFIDSYRNKLNAERKARRNKQLLILLAVLILSLVLLKRWL